MREFWESVHFWSEEKEQAHHDDWALRLITCTRRSCRRRRECAVPDKERKARCPGFTAYPLRQDEVEAFVPLIRAMLKQSIADAEAEDRESVRAEQAWRTEKSKARQRLAWERAKAFVKAKRQ